MNRHPRILGLLLLTAMLPAGCSLTPRVDRFTGVSYQYAKESQLADPSAGMARPPQVGLEGSVGEKVMDRYKATFDQPAPKTESYTINVNGVSAK